MSVSRQTISRWEADEIIPELNKLTALSDVFSCRIARYVMVTPNPEDADYAVITIYDPFAAAFKRIPNAYKRY